MKTCLVVDDSRVIRKVARRILEDLGFEVAEAADGLGFLKELRQTPEGDEPVVIFCTVENDLEHITLALDHGADEYIMKPFDGDILQMKLVEAGVLADAIRGRSL